MAGAQLSYMDLLLTEWEGANPLTGRVMGRRVDWGMNLHLFGKEFWTQIHCWAKPWRWEPKKESDRYLPKMLGMALLMEKSIGLMTAHHYGPQIAR